MLKNGEWSHRIAKDSATVIDNVLLWKVKSKMNSQKPALL